MKDDSGRTRNTRRIRNSKGIPSSSIIFVIALICGSNGTTELVSGWMVAPGNTPRAALGHRLQPPPPRIVWTSSSALRATEQDDRISEMDARVLQSMLRDNKLDLEQESNMKKLLERGIRKDNEDEEEDEETDKEEENDAYSSQIIKTLADTKFWKAFKRNAGELLETVAISVTNEIEKSAKVLVGLGFFAFDRAKRDVARAIPAASSWTAPKKKVFRLGASSSYVEPLPEEEDTEEALTPAQKTQSLREQFTTPADELSAVTAEIGKIFQRRNEPLPPAIDKSQDTRNPFFAAFAEELDARKGSDGGDASSAPYFASSATLSTTASRGSARLDQAFARTAKTRLAREKENPLQSTNRLAAAAIDSAYQVKAELRSEESVPGYKTKELRQSTADIGKQIAGAAQKTAGFLGAGASKLFLGGGEAARTPQLPTEASVTADPVDVLDDNAYFAFKRETDREPSTAAQAAASAEPVASPVEERTDLSGGVVIEDNKIVDTDDNNNGGGGAFDFLNLISKREKPEAPPSSTAAAAASAAASPSPPPEVEIITDAEVVMGNKDNFNYFASPEVSESGGSKDYFTTNSYLDNMEAADAPASSSSSTTGVVDDGLRQVTAEVITDDDFDESVFDQAKSVDNLSLEELLAQQAALDAEEADEEPSAFTKATLRTLDVAFLVVEKGLGVAPAAAELAQRAAKRATEAQLRDSSGSQVGWEPLKGSVRGEKRY